MGKPFSLAARIGRSLIARGKPVVTLPSIESKYTKVDVGYDSYSRVKHCDECKKFRPPGTCTLVKGDISMVGTCRFWEKK